MSRKPWARDVLWSGCTDLALQPFAYLAGSLLRLAKHCWARNVNGFCLHTKALCSCHDYLLPVDHCRVHCYVFARVYMQMKTGMHTLNLAPFSVC